MVFCLFIFYRGSLSEVRFVAKPSWGITAILLHLNEMFLMNGNDPVLACERLECSRSLKRNEGQAYICAYKKCACNTECRVGWWEMDRLIFYEGLWVGWKRCCLWIFIGNKAARNEVESARRNGKSEQDETGFNVIIFK